MAKLLITLILFTFSWAAAYDCKSTDTVDAEKLRSVIKKNRAQYTPAEENTFISVFSSLATCPEQNMNQPGLTANDKANFKKFLNTHIINGFEYLIANEIRFLNIDVELESYVRSYKAIHGQDAILPAGIRQIINNKDGYIDDRKKSCTTVNVDTTHMGPVRDQQDLGWCFAYSSADLISFHAKQQASAIDVGILYQNLSVYALADKMLITDLLKYYDVNRAWLESLGANRSQIEQQKYDSVFQGGFQNEAIRVALYKGVCSEKDLPSSEIDEHASLDLKRKSALLYKDTMDPNSSRICENNGTRVLSLFKNLNLGDLDEVLRKAKPESVLYDLRNKNCKSTIRIPDKRQITRKAPNYGQMFSVLDSQLDKKQPVATAYKFNMIQKDESGAHSSVIVGRKYNDKTKKCEYQVRNSWGKVNDYRLSTGVKHEDGYYWVDEANLRKNILGVDALD